MIPKTRPIPIKTDTIKLLNQIAEMKIKDAIDKKQFDVTALVRNKRGISWDKQINYLSRFFLESMKHYNKQSSSDKKKCVIGITLKKIGRMNSIA